jgi:two-component system repressor protein LuxO
VEQIFLSRPWPGNVRQLLNVIRNIVVLHDGPMVRPEMLPAEIAGGVAAPFARAQSAGPAWTAIPRTTREQLAALVGTSLAEIEREFIEATIDQCDGSIPRAARMLEVSPSTLYRKLETWSGLARRAGA